MHALHERPLSVFHNDFLGLSLSRFLFFQGHYEIRFVHYLSHSIRVILNA